MSIDVSIIVPIYNGEKHLDKCLSSLLSQNTCCKYEIIAVNDGSTDGTKDLLEKWEHLCRTTVEIIQSQNKSNKLLFIKSWNEWGEGNYLEPDRKYGRDYLDATSIALKH